MIESKIKHRFCLDDFKSRWQTAEEAFAHGDYTIIQYLPNASPEILAKATIMLGNPQKGLAIFAENNIDSLDSSYYKSFALWCLNRQTEAITLMEQLTRLAPEITQYNEFLKLLTMEKIHALLFGTISLQFVPYFKNSACFNIITVGSSDQFDIPINIDDQYTTLQQRLTAAPLFSLSFGPEAYSLPNFFPNLNFSKFGFVLDHDITLACKYDQICAFDFILCYSTAEHFELSQLYNRPTYTYHVFDYLPDVITATHSVEKDKEKVYDVFFTGFAFDTFFYSKAQLLYQLTTLDANYNVLINHNDARMSLGEYLRHMASSKFIPTTIRLKGTFSTRGIEAIHCGSNALVQENSFMHCILNGESDGLYEYSYENIVTEVESYIKNSSINQPKIPSADTLALFDPAQNAENLLKFCAFISIQPAQYNSEHKHNPILPFASSGCHFEHETNLIAFNQQITKFNLTANAKIEHFINASTAAVYNYFNEHSGNFTAICDIYANGLQRFPQSMALKFNYSRVLYHAGFHKESRIQLLELITNDTGWILDPLRHDLFCPVKFFKDDFPYIDYLDQVVLGTIRTDIKNQHVTNHIVISGAYYYLARVAWDQNDVAQCAKFCEQSLKEYPQNFITQAFSVPVFLDLYQTTHDTQHLIFLLDCYYQSAEKYPTFLHQNLTFAIIAETCLNNNQRIQELLDRWFLFFTRVRINFDYLPLTNSFFDLFLQHETLFPKVAILAFRKITAIRSSLFQKQEITLPVLSEKETSLLISYLKAITIEDYKEPIINFIDNQPENYTPDLLLFMAQICLDAKENEKSIALISNYLHRSGETAQMTKVFYIGQSYEQKQLLTEAHIVYQQLLEKTFDRKWLIYFRLGEMTKANNPEKAIGYYRQALTIFPGFIKANKALQKLLDG